MNAHAEVVALLEEIRTIAVSPVVRRDIERVTDLIEIITKAYMEPESRAVSWMLEFDLTSTEASIVDLLHRRMGKCVSRDAIHGALYWRTDDGGPDPKIIDVLICKLRPKLLDSSFEVESIHSEGYRLIPKKVTPLTHERAFFEGELVSRVQAEIANRLVKNLGAIVSKTEFKRCYKTRASAITKFNRRFAGQFHIETIKFVGYRMTAEA